jgi:hypothetical protein
VAFLSVNTPGDVIFKGAQGGVDIPNVLQSPQTAFERNDQAGNPGQLDPLDQSLNQVPKAGSDVGAKINRLETEQGKLSDVHDQLTQMLAEAKGTDLAGFPPLSHGLGQIGNKQACRHYGSVRVSVADTDAGARRCHVAKEGDRCWY